MCANTDDSISSFCSSFNNILKQSESDNSPIFTITEFSWFLADVFEEDDLKEIHRISELMPIGKYKISGTIKQENLVGVYHVLFEMDVRHNISHTFSIESIDLIKKDDVVTMIDEQAFVKSVDRWINQMGWALQREIFRNKPF